VSPQPLVLKRMLLQTAGGVCWSKQFAIGVIVLGYSPYSVASSRLWKTIYQK